MLPLRHESRSRALVILLLLLVPWSAQGLPAPGHPRQSAHTPASITLTVVDENGLAVPGASVTIAEPPQPPLHLTSDYDGRVSWSPSTPGTYSVHIAKPGFYQFSQQGLQTRQKSLRIALTHEQIVRQQVHVQASTPGINPERISNRTTMNVPEIVNIPFPVNRDIRDLLPYTPGVVADSTGQVHVAGGETFSTLYLLDGFDIRQPVTGALDLHVSTDAVRSIDTVSTRYPVNYGRSTAGVIALNTGMGDNKFRFNTTDFLPSFRSINGIHFDKFEPRFTFSGPVVRNHVWFFDGVDLEYALNYIPGLPSSADTNPLIRGSNLLKFQGNLGNSNSLSGSLLVNNYHAPYEGLSTLNPQQSTDKHDISAWLPYVRDEQSFKNGVMLDTGFSVMRYREGYEPHGTLPYQITPERTQGSNYSNTVNRSQRIEGYENIYLPPRHWAGTHQIRIGLNLSHIGYTQRVRYAPVNYLREDRTLLRRSVFPSFAPFSGHNLELGAYVEDRWVPHSGFLIEPGFRWDWDEIVRHPLFSPRIAFNYFPPGQRDKTKFSAGIGEYYGHTQLQYLTLAQAGTRYDTYYAADGTTPLGPPLTTTFTENDDTLNEPHALNWSVSLQREIPGHTYAGVSYMWRRTSDAFVYASQSGPAALSGHYVLTNDRQENYHSFQIHARHTFHHGYTLFGAWTHSSATTNAALDYTPTVSTLGRQQPGPLPWDTPNRILSWGWLPTWAPLLPTIHKNWDFVYTFEWSTGFPFNSIDANDVLVGAPGSHRFPNYFNFSPGLEWRFHFRGKYFAIRGLLENATDAMNPYVVNPNVDSPQYLMFSQPEGRAFTTRIRLIHSSK
jgi:hypothetical protein